MLWNQLIEHLLSFADLNLDDSLTVISLSVLHLSSVDNHDEEADEDKVHDGFNYVRLQVHRLLDDSHVVVQHEHHRHEWDQHRINLELERPSQESQHHVHREGHFDRFSVNEVVDHWPDENDHGEREKEIEELPKHVAWLLHFAAKQGKAFDRFRDNYAKTDKNVDFLALPLVNGNYSCLRQDRVKNALHDVVSQFSVEMFSKHPYSKFILPSRLFKLEKESRSLH